MDNSLVSVIIPTKNRSGYLKQALDSVYSQTYRHFEIIVVDDGSRDPVEAGLRHYDGRLRCISQLPAGVSRARNAGLEHAKGEYAAFLDDDDIWLPHKLERNMEYFSRFPSLGWLCSGFSFIGADGIPMERPPFIPEKEDVTLHDIAMFAFIHTSSVIAKLDVVRNAGGFPCGFHVSEDYHLWARILAMAEGKAIREPLTCFRRHPGNTRLPFWRLMQANTVIIGDIVSRRVPGLASREVYMRNLRRIVGESLLYRREYLQYAAFCFLYRTGLIA